MSFLHLFPPPFFPVTWLVVLFFFLLTAFFTNMVRCYIRTPLKLTFLNSVTFFLPIFLTSFDASGLIIKYWHWTSAICKREHTWRVQPKLICFKKINIENKSIIVGIYERTCIRFSCFIQRTQDNLHVRLVQVVLKEASQDGTQQSLKLA